MGENGLILKLIQNRGCGSRENYKSNVMTHKTGTVSNSSLHSNRIVFIQLNFDAISCTPHSLFSSS
jgi:hypothetical protein